MNQEINIFWQSYLKEAKLDIATSFYEAFHFCDDETSANELLKLVLSGEKTATTSSYLAYKNFNEMPKVGCYSIVTDWLGKPFCVIQTNSIKIMKFSEMTFELAKLEGEDDNLASWQQNHLAYFKQDGVNCDYQFSWDMPILFEEFVVVYKSY